MKWRSELTRAARRRKREYAMNSIGDRWAKTLLSSLLCVLPLGCHGERVESVDVPNHAGLSMTTPYENESDMGPTREAFSCDDRAPWGFAHNGIDFFPKGNLKLFRSVSSGVVAEVNLWQNDKTSNWQVNVAVECGPAYTVVYGFEPMTGDRGDGKTQLANILVSKGQRLSQGHPIGRLHTAAEGAHVHFGLLKQHVAVSPEPYFSPEARASVLRLIRKAWPGAAMSYGAPAKKESAK